MSTILEALRRLEEDNATSEPDGGLPPDTADPTGAAADGKPRPAAADPRATDELRDRILAEERANQPATSSRHADRAGEAGEAGDERGPSASRDSSGTTSWRWGPLAAVGLVVLVSGAFLVPSLFDSGLAPRSRVAAGESEAASARVAARERPAPAIEASVDRRRVDPPPSPSPSRTAIPTPAAAAAQPPVAPAAPSPAAQPAPRPPVATPVASAPPPSASAPPSASGSPDPSGSAKPHDARPIAVSALPIASAESRRAPNPAPAPSPTPSPRAASASSPHAAPSTPTTETPRRGEPERPSASLALVESARSSRVAEAKDTPIRPRPTPSERAPDAVSAAGRSSAARVGEASRTSAPGPRTRAGEGRARDTANENPPARGSTAPPIERISRPDIPDLTVLRTAWHPNPDRRSARIRLEASEDVLTLREGDAIGSLVVKEISPSAVLFEAGEVELRRRVGTGR